MLLDRDRAETVEAAGRRWPTAPWPAGDVRTDVQPMAVVSELMEAEELLRLHPEFQAAMARRGVTDPDADPGRRLAGRALRRAPRSRSGGWPAAWRSSSRRRATTSGPTRSTGVHRAGRPEHARGAARRGPRRRAGARRRAATSTPPPARRCATDIAPLEITQPDGPGFTVEGRVIALAALAAARRLHARGGARAAPARLRGRRALRPIMHRASLSEMVVPYGDPSPTHYFKNAFDAGENGVGVAASPLTRGCDCLGEIVYLDAVVNDSAGEPVTIPNAICMHEEDTGVLWRHIEWRDGTGEVRRSRRLVISSLLGDRELRLRLLLVPLPGRHDRVRGEADRRALDRRGGARACSREHGTLVAPGLNAMVHQHFFNMRLDLDVDGARERRRGGVDGVASAGPGQPGTATPSGRCAGGWRPSSRRRRRLDPRVGPLVGDREPGRPPPAGRAGRLPAACPARTPCRSPSPTRRSASGPASSPSTCG